jgi:hypothetical protein
VTAVAMVSLVARLVARLVAKLSGTLRPSQWPAEREDSTMPTSDDKTALAGGHADDEVPADHAPMGSSAGKRNWIAWSPEGSTNIPDGLRTEIEDRIRQARSEMGALLAIVEVRVFEHDAEAQVSFPPDGLLRPDDDREVVADVVRRAREELDAWR